MHHRNATATAYAAGPPFADAILKKLMREMAANE